MLFRNCTILVGRAFWDRLFSVSLGLVGCRKGPFKTTGSRTITASSRSKKLKIQELSAAVADIQKRINRLLEEKKEEEVSELLTEAKGAQLRANIRWAE